MPEQRDADYYESGRATAPPGIYYISPTGGTSEGYNHPVAPVSLNLTDPESDIVESAISGQNINSLLQQRLQLSPPYSTNCLPAVTSSLNFSSAASKFNVANNSFQSSNNLDCSVTSDVHKFLPVNNFPFNNSLNNNNNQNIGNYYIDNFEFLTSSKPQPKALQSPYTSPDSFALHTSEQHPVSVINYPKTSKSDSVSIKEPPNYSACLFPNQQNQSKFTQDKEGINPCLDKNLKKDLEVIQKTSKFVKDDPELNYNLEELQQFLSKCGTKIKITQDSGQDLVTNSILHYLQKKNLQENSSCDFGDLSQFLSLGKYKPDDVSGLKKRESNEDSKLMNDFLAKIILEQEEKKFKVFDEKKKTFRKEFFDELGDGLDEKKIKRDAMSHYQEDKNHHKKSSNYGDFSQWDYFGQQDIQHSNNHNRRGHISFGGAHQPPNPGWNSMRMGMPRQTNPYYSNPHGHMMPAHAHSDYRYNQWNNPNHKSLPNVHSAHSQNTILPQAKLDKHLEISNAKQDFNLPVGTTSDFSKFWAASRDLMHSTPSTIPDKFSRSSVHPDHLASTPHSIKNAPALRNPPPASHPKTVVNPLSDLQMLVTNQDVENPPQKSENFQQETVDLSAHSDISKQKENFSDKTLNVINKDKQESSSCISVIQNKNKLIESKCSESEKPVELTSKSIEKSFETETSGSLRNCAENTANTNKIVEIVQTVKKTVNATEIIVKKNEDSIKVEEPPISSKVKDIPCLNLKNESEKDNKKINTSDTKQQVEIQGEGKVDEKCVEKSVSPESNKENKSSKESEEKAPSEAAPKVNGNEESLKHEKRKTPDEEFSASKKVCLEIGFDMEKTLEGFGESNLDLPKITSTSAETKSTINESTKKFQKKKPSRKSRFGRLSSGQSSSSERSLPSKKSKILGSKEDNRKKFKKSLCDVMDRRGPFLHVEGPKESPSSVIVVNFPKGDDEDEKDKSLVKKQTSTITRSKHQNELDYRGRSRNGMFCSTLSARYDAHTTDHSWICVFCKRGPHYNMLGDLFGPYIISKDENTALCDFSGDEKDISDAQKRGGRNKKSLRSNNMVEHFQKMSRKLRRTQSIESCLTGMTVISEDLTDEVRYEVWVHEQCAVWSPNVCLIGSRIIGMQEAIWSCTKVICSKCGNPGANIGCVYRNCPNRSHYSCAKESGWSLVQETFISTCPIHKPRLSLPSANQQSETL